MTWKMSFRGAAALLLLALGGCVWLMDAVPTWEVTFQGTVRRADGTPVEGAQVAIWLDPPGETLRPPPPFGAVFTPATGEFRMRDELRARVSPPDVFIRVFPPQGSGLAPLAFEGRANEPFTITRDDRRVRYEGDLVLQPAAAP